MFALNILAFIFIGLQIRPILESLAAADRGRYLVVAGAVLLTVIVVRLAWHMSFNAVVRWRHRRLGFHPPRPMLRPTVGSGLVISWAGMRGIRLARGGNGAARGVSVSRPDRADRVLCRARHAGDPGADAQASLARARTCTTTIRSAAKLSAARERALRAGLASFEQRSTRRSRMRSGRSSRCVWHPDALDGGDAPRSAHDGEIHRAALQAARQSRPRDAGQRRDRRRCLPSNRRGIGLARNGSRPENRERLTPSVFGRRIVIGIPSWNSKYKFGTPHMPALGYHPPKRTPPHRVRQRRRNPGSGRKAV